MAQDLAPCTDRADRTYTWGWHNTTLWAFKLKLQAAIEAYLDRWGRRPTIVFVNRIQSQAKAAFDFEGVNIIPSESVAMDDFYLRNPEWDLPEMEYTAAGPPPGA